MSEFNVRTGKLFRVPELLSSRELEGGLGDLAPLSSLTPLAAAGGSHGPSLKSLALFGAGWGACIAADYFVRKRYPQKPWEYPDSLACFFGYIAWPVTFPVAMLSHFLTRRRQRLGCCPACHQIKKGAHQSPSSSSASPFDVAELSEPDSVRPLRVGLPCWRCGDF